MQFTAAVQLHHKSHSCCIAALRLENDKLQEAAAVGEVSGVIVRRGPCDVRRGSQRNREGECALRRECVASMDSQCVGGNRSHVLLLHPIKLHLTHI